MIPKTRPMADETPSPSWQSLPEALRRRVVAQLVPLLIRHISQPVQAKEAQAKREVKDE